MIVEDEVLHMKSSEVWYSDTRNYHSQFNGSEVERIHVVASLYKLQKNNSVEDWTRGNDYY